MEDLIRRSDVFEAVGEAYNRFDNWDAFATAIKSIPAIEPKQEWIPCNKRLPEANEQDEQGFYKAYLVQRNNKMHTARWNGEHWILWTIGTVLDGVTAWMPLPKPYKEGAEDEVD
jgi:hypothetical protein